MRLGPAYGHVVTIALSPPICDRFIFTYGALLITLLGPDAERSFITSWGGATRVPLRLAFARDGRSEFSHPSMLAVSYGVGAAAEWKQVATEAIQGVVLLAILERLHLTRRVNWFEVRAFVSSRTWSIR